MAANGAFTLSRMGGQRFVHSKVSGNPMLSNCHCTPRRLPLLALAVGALCSIPLLGQAAPQTEGTWRTTLQARDLDGNLATTEAYYDTVLNVTWLADANYAQTVSAANNGVLITLPKSLLNLVPNSFSPEWDPRIIEGLAPWEDSDFVVRPDLSDLVASNYTTVKPDNGKLTWETAKSWLASLRLGGVSGWRLPNVVAAEGISPYGDEPGGGYDISAPSNELAHLVHVTLGNSSSCEGGKVNCGRLGERSFQSGPFINVQPDLYWSNTVSPSDYPWADFVFSYDMRTNYQGTQLEGQELHAWALHSGDVGVAIVPEPGTLPLYALGGLLMLAAVRRHHRR